MLKSRPIICLVMFFLMVLIALQAVSSEDTPNTEFARYGDRQQEARPDCARVGEFCRNTDSCCRTRNRVKLICSRKSGRCEYKQKKENRNSL